VLALRQAGPPEEVVAVVFQDTDFAEDLLVHCDMLPGWPDKVTTMQRNWIGKSIGAEIRFPVEDSERSISVFTTRQDTVFGATFMCLAPEHPLVPQCWRRARIQAAVDAFVERISLQERSSKAIENYEKRGVYRCLLHQSHERSAHAHLHGQFRPDGIRHRRRHVRAGP
jgi:leucyl-tRNA synthetase